MRPLMILLITFVIIGTLLRIIQGSFDLPFTARLAMSVMLLFAAFGHFLFKDEQTFRVPDFIPFKSKVIFITATIEVCGAIGLHISQFRTVTAWALIVFFVLSLLSNAKAGVEQIDYQKATYNGLGISYLLFRVPLQVLLVIWVYVSSIHG